MNGLFAAGLILLALAAIVGRFQRWWPYLLGAAGSACLAVLGGFALAGRSVQLDVAGWLGNPVPGQQAAALGADRLSGLFLALSFGAAVPVSVAFASWAARAQPTRRWLGASYALALGAVAVIMTARDAFTALFGWETLTLAFYLLSSPRGDDPPGDPPGTGGLSAPRPPWPGDVGVRQGQRGRVRRPAAPRDQVALDPAGLVRPCPGRRGPHHRRGAAARRVRGQGRPGAVPGLAAPRVHRRPRPGPRDHGRRLRQRGLLRHVAHVRADRPGARLADRRAAGARRAERAARHRPRGGAEPAVPGDRLLQRREHRAHRHRVRRRADRRGGGRPAPGRGRAAGRHAAGGHAHRGQVPAVHLVRRDRGRHRRRRPGGVAGPAGGPGGSTPRGWHRTEDAVEWVRAGRGLADAGRAAAHGGLRVGVVPAGIADAAVPGARPRLPPGAGPGRRRGRPHRRLRRRHLRPSRRAGLSRGERSPPDSPCSWGGLPVPPNPPGAGQAQPQWWRWLWAAWRPRRSLRWRSG